MIRKHVTLSMIAEACETSVGTVSRALNQKADSAQVLPEAAGDRASRRF